MIVLRKERQKSIDAALTTVVFLDTDIERVGSLWACAAASAALTRSGSSAAPMRDIIPFKSST